MQFLLAGLGPMSIDRVRSAESEKAYVLTGVRSISQFFSLILRQRSYSDYTLGLLDGRLATFYKTNSVFLTPRGTKASNKNCEKR